MKLTPEQILERMERFVDAAQRVKALKDYLLTFNFVDNHVDWLEEELARHDEAVEEVGRIYDEEMIPIINEIGAYVGEHQEAFSRLVEAEMGDASLASRKAKEALDSASKSQATIKVVCPDCGKTFEVAVGDAQAASPDAANPSTAAASRPALESNAVAAELRFRPEPETELVEKVADVNVPTFVDDDDDDDFPTVVIGGRK